MKNFSKLLILLFVCLSVTACKEKVPTVVNEQWLGKWDGPEGTFLNVDKDGVGYSVIIQDLDGPKSFYGTPIENGISFTRGGVPEVIHHGSGQSTGMKWLAEKKDCLIVKKGEGFCRD